MVEEVNRSRREPAELVPHAGAMVLIDEVVDWNAEAVHCRSRIDQPADHPLSRGGRLPAEALGEFGAQAMAVHGGLLAPQGEPPRHGLLASMGKLDLAIGSIDRAATLDIRAMRLGGDSAGMVYEFSIAMAGHEVASGRATVMFPELSGDGS